MAGHGTYARGTPGWSAALFAVLRRRPRRHDDVVETMAGGWSLLSALQWRGGDLRDRGSGRSGALSPLPLLTEDATDRARSSSIDCRVGGLVGRPANGRAQTCVSFQPGSRRGIGRALASQP